MPAEALLAAARLDEVLDPATSYGDDGGESSLASVAVVDGAARAAGTGDPPADLLLPLDKAGLGLVEWTTPKYGDDDITSGRSADGGAGR